MKYSYQLKSQIMMKRYCVLLSLFFSALCQLSFSQTCTNVVGGTKFQALAGHETDYYYDFNLVKQLGPSGNSFSSAAKIADSAQQFVGTNFVYAVTANPKKLRSDFVNIDDSMLVIRMQTSGNQPLFNYKITGLKAGSGYTVKMKLYHLPVLDSACQAANPWLNSSIKIGVNPDAYCSTCTDLALGSSAATSWGKSFDFTSTGTLAASESTANIQINTGYNFASCSAIGISSIEVIGCLDPKIKSSQGNEVCTGEQTLLTLDKEYNASSYAWQKSSDGVTWTTFGGNNKSVLDPVSATTFYRVSVGGTLSNTLKITTITCCATASGSGSREKIFFDDFGHFTAAHSYVDAFGVTTATPATDAAYRANVSYTMPGHTYDGPGGVNDGSYAIASYVPKNIAPWFGGVAEDHSQEPDGGQLFINVTKLFTGVIYDRTITGLCPGKELFFDTYIANASGGTNPVVTLNILNPSGVIVSTATSTATVGGGWIRINPPSFVLPGGTTSIRIQLVSTGGQGTSGDSYWTGGNDLLLDDIKIMACAPPNFDLFSDLPTLTKNKEVCTDPILFNFSPSALLTAFYGGNPYYLYQWSKTPTVASSWTNIGTPQTNSSYTVANPKINPMFAGTKNGDKIYVRVIAATASVFSSKTNFTAPNYADATDFCKNYSISASLELTVKCPTCNPVLASDLPLTISTTPTTGNLCPSQSATILSKTIHPTTAGGKYDFVWYKTAIATGNEVKTTSTTTSATSYSDSYTVSATAPGLYVLVVRDHDMPTAAACQYTANVTITANTAPSYTITGGGSYCSNSTPTPVKFNLTSGVSPF